jgi:hypothetical protein
MQFSPRRPSTRAAGLCIICRGDRRVRRDGPERTVVVGRSGAEHWVGGRETASERAAERSRRSFWGRAPGPTAVPRLRRGKAKAGAVSRVALCHPLVAPGRRSTHIHGRRPPPPPDGPPTQRAQTTHRSPEYSAIVVETRDVQS